MVTAKVTSTTTPRHWGTKSYIFLDHIKIKKRMKNLNPTSLGCMVWHSIYKTVTLANYKKLSPTKFDLPAAQNRKTTK